MSTTPQQLPLVPEPTDWLDGEPPFTGWYDTRRKSNDEEARSTVLRRFYQGGGRYSRPAPVFRKDSTSVFSTGELQYRGLTGPAPEGYEYDVADSRTGEIVQLANRPDTARRRLKA